MTRPKPLMLIILDGWGERQEKENNPTKSIPTPTIDSLMQGPHTFLEASGPAVGLPENQMGNSEVGHFHIGSGRKVPQDITRIDLDIASGQFFQNKCLIKAIEIAKIKNSNIHLLGLLSPGGVHSHERHLASMVDMLTKFEFKNYYIHAFLDGRDVPPQSALSSLKKFNNIVSIIGRYYAMDRDSRWDRTETAYNLLTEGIAEYHAQTAEEALNMAYARGETDEFVKPTSIHSSHHAPIFIKDDDVIIFMNYRPDRARQLTKAFLQKDFKGFSRATIPNLALFVTLTNYARDIPAEAAYPPLTLTNTLGEYLSQLGFSQLRIAETEKYAHVTYFLNGGLESSFPNEERILIPSPKVATYDLQPEMSAYEITEQLVKAIIEQRFDVIFCNYANPDMVGHTGNVIAAERAVHVVDDCLKQVLEALAKVNGEAFITADHGNIELMFNKKNGQPHTAHTMNLVPFIYVGRPAFFINRGALDDVAPTFLYALGLKPPPEMTGKNLLQFLSDDTNENY